MRRGKRERKEEKMGNFDGFYFRHKCRHRQRHLLRHFALSLFFFHLFFSVVRLHFFLNNLFKNVSIKFLTIEQAEVEKFDSSKLFSISLPVACLNWQTICPLNHTISVDFVKLVCILIARVYFFPI